MTYKPPTWPVSVKGVALDASGRVALLKNERREWELPGGRLEIGGGAGGPVGDYRCTVLTPHQPPVVSPEHSHLGLFTADEIDGLTMPQGYKRSIAAWYGRS